MMAFLVGSMDLRSADEGRSYFTGKVGEKLFADFVTPEERPHRPGDALRAVRRRRHAAAPAAMDRRRARQGAPRLALLGAEEGRDADRSTSRLPALRRTGGERRRARARDQARAARHALLVQPHARAADGDAHRAHARRPLPRSRTARSPRRSRTSVTTSRPSRCSRTSTP